MDNILHPDVRKWISQEIHIGDTMDATIQGNLELGLMRKFDKSEAERQLRRQERKKEGASQPDLAALDKMWTDIMKPKDTKDEEKKVDEEESTAAAAGPSRRTRSAAAAAPTGAGSAQKKRVGVDAHVPVEGIPPHPRKVSTKSKAYQELFKMFPPGSSDVLYESDSSSDENSWKVSNDDSSGDEGVLFRSDSPRDGAGDEALAADETEEEDKWIKMGVKSGPTRLLSGDKSATTQQFASFMERAFTIKTARELRFAEEFKEEIMKEMGITEEKFQKLQEACSPALGAVRGESFKDEPVVRGTEMPVLIPPIPDADKIELKSLSVLLCSSNPTDPIWRSNNVQQQIDDNLKLAGKRERHQARLKDYAEEKPGLVDNYKDFVVEVSVYCGRNPDESLPADIKPYTEPKLVYKLHLLGTNTVAELRAAIHCDNELVATAEVQNPDDVVCREEILKYKILPWVLVIGNDIFGEGADFAAALTDWINEKPPKNLGPFRERSNKTLLRDLTVRFGYPYVYIHVGKCEHIIVINNARMITESDEHRIEKYPVMASIPNLKNVFCRVDNEHMATWSVVDCEQFPENPMLICTTCLRNFCYNQDGTKRLPFRLFPFRQLANEI